jgi:hypothetical protein
MATKANINHKILSVSDAWPHMMHTKVAQQLSTPLLMLNIMMKKKHTSELYIYSARQKKLKTFKYEKTEYVLLVWFRQKWTINT